jgi:hypothetical protein
MTISWPANTDFPQYFLIGTVSGGPKDVSIRTDVAQGPSRVRSRYTNPEEEYTGVLLFPTRALFQIFQAFFKTTLQNGTQQFSWYHPLTMEATTMRFAGSYSDQPQTDQVHRVTVNVEIIP